MKHSYFGIGLGIILGYLGSFYTSSHHVGSNELKVPSEAAPVLRELFTKIAESGISCTTDQDCKPAIYLGVSPCSTPRNSMTDFLYDLIIRAEQGCSSKECFGRGNCTVVSGSSYGCQDNRCRNLLAGG